MGIDRIKLRQLRVQITYLPRTLAIIQQAAGRWTIFWLLLLAVQGVLPAGNVYLTRFLVDGLADAIGGGFTWQNAQPLLVLGGAMGTLMLLGQVLQSVVGYVRTAQSELVRDHLSYLIHDKAITLDLAYYETPNYYDQLHRAREDAVTRPLALLESSGNLLQNGITLLAMAALLIPYGVWLPFVLLISTLPAFYTVLYFNRLYHNWWQRRTADRRWTQYYDNLLTFHLSAAEVRLFALGDYFKNAYQSLRQRLRQEHLAILRRQTVARLLSGLLTLLLTAGVMVWMLWRALLGAFTLGDLAMFYQAFSKGQGIFSSLLGNINQIYNNILFLGNMFSFLEQEPSVVDPQRPQPFPSAVKDGLTFHDVAFAYPGSERQALRHFNLTLPANKIVAIVGANGAGKSTLLKLLCRFYDPQNGRITIDGTDLRQFSLADLRRHLTVLFQDPVPYNTTAAENITLGDLHHMAKPAEIEAAAHSAGAHDFIARLPQGYDSLLGKAFAGGTDLSGGEWQRLALARAFLRRSPIMILDEPTSALDSWSEVDWFDRLRQLAAGRTTVVITHRFTIARHADLIYVMDAGAIVESGSHEQLVALNGRYAYSWQQQIRPTNGPTLPASFNGHDAPPEAVQVTHE